MSRGRATGVTVPRPRDPLSRDRNLLGAVALGDLGAWDALVEAHAGVVWSTCMRCGLPPDEAVVVSQLVWLDLVDALPHLGMPLDTWLIASTTLESKYANLRAAAGRGDTAHRGDRRRRPRNVAGVKS